MDFTDAKKNKNKNKKTAESQVKAASWISIA
jgi:hypothetical protein